MDLLAENPLLLLFVVAATGYLAGRVHVGGFSLGISAVLFTGIAAGAIDERLQLPELVHTLGLALFVYTIGLASGPGFISALRRRGLRDNLLVLGVLASCCLLAMGAGRALGFGDRTTAGLFAGSLTNTPALAAVLESLRHAGASAAEASDPVVAYSLAYPMGVVGMLGAIFVLQRRFRVDYEAEGRGSPALAALAGDPLVLGVARVLRDDLPPVGRLLEERGGQVVFGRVRHGADVRVPDDAFQLRRGDVVSVIGRADAVESTIDLIGEPCADELTSDRTILDVRRVFVSNTDLVGRRVGDLGLPEQFGAVATRVRRGDIDLLASDDVMLELGDRVRVVAPRERMGEVSHYFGDSYRALGEIDVMTFSLGIALGLLLGLVPVPLGGGADLRLGFAGGPLVVGLLLGARHRTGPLVWQIPYSANLTLRQFGTVLFLAGIGTRSGQAFHVTISEGQAVKLVGAGAVITLVAAVTTLVIGYRVLRRPMGVLTGVLAGLQTQPAVLAFATEQAGNDLPSLGYSTVYPVAMVTKILLAELLLVALA